MSRRGFLHTNHNSNRSSGGGPPWRPKIRPPPAPTQLTTSCSFLAPSPVPNSAPQATKAELACRVTNPQALTVASSCDNCLFQKGMGSLGWLAIQGHGTLCRKPQPNGASVPRSPICQTDESVPRRLPKTLPGPSIERQMLIDVSS